jgi:voltage-gated potassium channel
MARPMFLFACLYLTLVGAAITRVAGPTYRDQPLDITRVFGWQQANRSLRERMERLFSVPMIFVALLILPILAVEHYFARMVEPHDHLWLVLLIDGCTALIWIAFAAEFIVMLSVADSKLKYCKSHWLDLAIIILPLISFARALRLARTMRLGQIGRMSRLYRLRGLAMRGYRAVLMLELLQRLIRRSPEKQLQALRQVLAEREAEIEELRRTIAQLELQVAASQVASAQPHAAPAPLAATGQDLAAPP